MNGENLTENINQQAGAEHLDCIKQFCLLDDLFMTKCLENAPECVELILRIILVKTDLKVREAKTQVFVANLLNRSVRLDVVATDSQGRRYNIEIQKAGKGAAYKRARYNSSMLDINALPKSEDFADLPETYVIFITEKDFVGQGRPVYPIERCNLVTGEIIPDDEHIIYVNGAYQDDSALGRLMQDFANPEPASMNYAILAERTRFFKESKEGKAIMSGVIEKMWQEAKAEGLKEGLKEGVDKGVNEARRENALRMLAAGKYELQEIADITGLTLAEVKKLQSEKSA